MLTSSAEERLSPCICEYSPRVMSPHGVMGENLAWGSAAFIAAARATLSEKVAKRAACSGGLAYTLSNAVVNASKSSIVVLVLAAAASVLKRAAEAAAGRSSNRSSCATQPSREALISQGLSSGGGVKRLPRRSYSWPCGHDEGHPCRQPAGDGGGLGGGGRQGPPAAVRLT